MPPPEPAEGGDIIIKGGSAEIHFKDDHFKKDEGDPKKRRREEATITRIEVSGTGNDFTEDFANGYTGTIKVTYK